MSSSVALARKWRPKQFTDVVGQSVVIQALTNAINQNRLHHAYLLTGTRGVGKTTIARILAKCLNCKTGITASPCGTCSHCLDIDSGRFPDLFEIDAASRTKVEDTRDILDNVPYAPISGRFKIYLIDEVHMLSGHSFNALLKTLEEPPSHVKFILATTDPQKLPATVLSRCLQFHLNQLSIPEINQQLEHILTAENIAFDRDAVTFISQAAQGSLRDALSVLDQSIAFGAGAVLKEATSRLLGTIDRSLLNDLLGALALREPNRLLDMTAILAQKGANFSTVLAELLTVLHDVALAQLVPVRPHDPVVATLATQFTPENVHLYYQMGLIGQRDLDYAPTPQNGFEMVLLRMLAAHSGAVAADGVRTDAAPVPIQAKTTEKLPQTWQEIFEALSLTGTARLLAEQCSLVTLTENKIDLALQSKYKSLLQDAILQRIKEAVNGHFKRTVALSIVLTDVEALNPPPAELKRRDIQKVHDEATEALYNDEAVQKIIRAFDAKVIKETIKPVE